MKKNYSVKLVFVSIIFICVINNLKAQMVYMPDANLRNYLATYGYNTCISGNYIDASCPAVVNTTTLTISNYFNFYSPIYDLTGIDAFTNLDTLIFNYFPITTLPSLPGTLTYLDCDHNSLISLPTLPNTLLHLNCNTNAFTIFPILPNSLTSLDLGRNQLASIGSLPNSLIYFNCDTNQLNALPPLPASLSYLLCSKNNFVSLPTLPSSLFFLDCSWNQIPTLPVLPATIVHLDYRDNLVSIFPSMPNSLVYLNCSYNSISSLPALSTSLDTLICNHNQISGLPALPNVLRYLVCSSNPLVTLPSLPQILNTLDCRLDQLTSLPSLSDSLRTLYCDQNQIAFLPTLPNVLSYLNCSHNQISSIPTLPNTLNYLVCENNQITSIPTLPSTLEALWCSYNQLTVLPLLPDTMYNLHCSHNQLTNLPTLLPVSLQSLDCSYNALTTLPTPQSVIIYFYCDHNQLTSLPELPNHLGHVTGMWEFYCNDNPNLTCLPKLNSIHYLRFDGTAVTCLPNYGDVASSVPPLNSLPLCGLFNNSGCDFFWNISGRTYFDENVNCIFDTTDAGKQNMHLMLYQNDSLIQQMFTGGEGFYSFDTDTSGIYSVKLDTTNIQFSLLCPSSDNYSDTIAAIDTLFYDNDFSLKCKPGYDVGAWCIYAWHLKPAIFSTVYIHAGDLSNFYGARCATGISGTVTITLNGYVHYVSPAFGALAPNNVLGNVLTYNIPDFGAINLFDAFNVVVQTDTNAIINSPVCIQVAVASLGIDNNPSNDTLTHCFNIVNSWDPNEKEVSPLSNVDPTGERWLTYTINFENTGTASANNIYITDTLDSNLDLSTFQLLAYSHHTVVQILEGGIARFNFPNINLPDSNTNEPGSHGYVQYKIKVKDNATVGTQINNTAYIYFDFNAPVITNTTVNTVTNSVGIATINNDLQVSVFPNPTRSEFTVYCPQFTVGKKIRLKLLDLFGKELLIESMRSSNYQLLTNDCPSGIYFLRIETADGVIVKKLVKE